MIVDMIARICGMLESLGSGVGLIDSEAGLTYEVLLPGYVVGRLGGRIGQKVTLHTLHFFESQNQGATLVPRLAGFLTLEEKNFFELFTTCRGIGHRKALRAMSLDVATIATAIADRDVALLQSLPEIGRRTAETVIAALHGKIDRFIDVGRADRAETGDGSASSPAAAGGLRGIGRDALELLAHLGENRVQAAQWIDEALRGGETFEDVQQLLARVYAIRGS